MRFEIESATTGGLKVINEIPDVPLCRLEGYNGVGKTVAIHLLEIATGGQPYAHRLAAWRSLKDRLTAATIRVSGLRNDGSLEIQLDPKAWPTASVLPDDSFGSAWLNGESIAFSSVGRWLKVTRIGGDETMIVQIRQRLQAHAGAFARQDERLQQSLEPLEALADRLHEMTAGLSPDERAIIAARLSVTSEARSRAERNLAELAKRARAIDGLIALEAALTQITEKGPALDAQLTTIERSLHDSEQRRKDLERQRDQLRPLAERVADLNSTIARLKRRRAIQRGRLARERAKLGELLATLEMDASAVRDALESGLSERASLGRDRAAIALLPESVHLLDTLDSSLASIAGSPLDDEVIAVVESGRLSARQLRTGVESRREELRKLDDYAVVEQIDVRLHQLDQRIGLLERAASVIPSIQRNEDSAEATERDLEAAYQEAEADTDASYRAVMGQLRELADELVRLVEARATLRQSRAMLDRFGSAETLQEQISDARTNIGSTEPASQLLVSQRSSLERARKEFSDAEEQQREAVTASEQFDARAESAWRSLRGDAYRWLHTIDELRLPDRFSVETVTPQLARITSLVERFRNLVDVLPRRTGRLQEALAGLDREIGKGPIESDPDREALLAYYEGELAQLLRSPEIAETVLEGGEFQEIDLAAAEIAWTDKKGSPIRRPIEAFSSGEAAFTYILASILQRSDVAAENRVLILDEFGAFIQGDRIRVLLEFLRREVLEKHRADQVVVVLPLRQLDDGEAPDEAELRKQVEQRGYGVTVLST
jgi:hypothetical protein